MTFGSDDGNNGFAAHWDSSWLFDSTPQLTEGLSILQLMCDPAFSNWALKSVHGIPSFS
jgi:hypothetical protein